MQGQMPVQEPEPKSDPPWSSHEQWNAPACQGGLSHRRQWGGACLRGARSVAHTRRRELEDLEERLEVELRERPRRVCVRMCIKS